MVKNAQIHVFFFYENSNLVSISDGMWFTWFPHVTDSVPQLVTKRAAFHCSHVEEFTGFNLTNGISYLLVSNVK